MEKMTREQLIAEFGEPGAANLSSVDLIEVDPASGQVLLVMIEIREWDSGPQQFRQIEEKINRYMGYVLDGHLTSHYPQYEGQGVQFRLNCAQAPCRRRQGLRDRSGPRRSSRWPRVRRERHADSRNAVIIASAPCRAPTPSVEPTRETSRLTAAIVVTFVLVVAVVRFHIVGGHPRRHHPAPSMPRAVLEGKEMTFASRSNRGFRSGSVADVFREDFEGNRAVEVGVCGLTHFRHPAHADLCRDAIRTEAGAGSQGHEADKRLVQ